MGNGPLINKWPARSAAYGGLDYSTNVVICQMSLVKRPLSIPLKLYDKQQTDNRA